MAYIYDIADTWAASGTVFTGIKLNVTDTASAAGSLLMDLQVGGASRFSVAKDGTLATSSHTVRLNTGSTANTLIDTGINGFNGFVLGRCVFGARASRIALESNMLFGWSSSSSNPEVTADVLLARDAANTLAQRNGVNAQAFNLYNTYTDASNYERGFMRFVSNALEIGTGAAGTGTGRDVSIKTQSGRYLTLSNGSTLNSNAVYTRFYDGSTVVANINVNSQQFVIASGGSFTFSSGADSFSTAVDTGIARSAAGVAKITNGSTGTGKLIFIVPTTDPGITGALWNNAGTLAISA